MPPMDKGKGDINDNETFARRVRVPSADGVNRTRKRSNRRR